MFEYIAFLRGINVGGHTKISMQDLKKVFEKLGYENVRTMFNSGNVIFKVKQKDKDIIKKQLEEELLKTFGFGIKVIIRADHDLKLLVDQNPFSKVNITPQTRLYITFTENRDIINSIEITVSKDTTDLMKDMEKENGKNITTRNWNTILKIVNLLSV